MTACSQNTTANDWDGHCMILMSRFDDVHAGFILLGAAGYCTTGGNWWLLLFCFYFVYLSAPFI